MTSVLFVSNGHGEAAIAGRIARDLHAIVPDARIDHLGLVGESASPDMREVGPRHTMPSGGLVAMGNARNLLRDLRAGLLGLIRRQRRFLRDVRGRYDAAVAVGDVYALGMTLRVKAPTVFVGTAKSVYVAPYGRYERRLLSRALVRFVRDEPTAQRLRRDGLAVEPGANVIVDLFAPEGGARVAEATRDFAPLLAILPGSRASAYGDATFLLEVFRQLVLRYPRLGAVLSIARGLDASRFANDAAANGWEVRGTGGLPFTLALGGRTAVAGWSGGLGDVFARATLVMGQAGTANEGAAGQGVPVIAFSAETWGPSRWYRRRQEGLLGEALVVAPRRLPEAANAVAALLDDPRRRRAMSDAGRARMGESGAAARIAQAIVRVMRERPCVA